MNLQIRNYLFLVLLASIFSINSACSSVGRATGGDDAGLNDISIESDNAISDRSIDSTQKIDQMIDHLILKDSTFDLAQDTSSDLPIPDTSVDSPIPDLTSDGPVSCDDNDPCTHSDIITTTGCKGTAYTCNDNDKCTIDSCLGDGTCSFVGSYPCTIGYTIGISHSSGYVSSISNRVKLMEVRKTAADKISAVLIEDMGSFKDKPAWWDVWYVTDNPPPLCYDRYTEHSGTIFEGLTQSYFPGTSPTDLVAKIRGTLSNTYTYRWPSNSAGGDLCQSGNWWTTLKFTADGATHIENLLKPYGP